MSLDKEKSKGIQAKRFLEDEIFTNSVKRIRQPIDLEWKNSPMRDSEAREWLYTLSKALDMIVNEITSVAETGKLANKQLSKEHKDTLYH